VEILVLDIETTGLNNRTDFILELGMVSLNIETGVVTKLFDKVFRPEGLTAKHREAWIFENKFMEVEEVRKAESMEIYRDQIQGYLTLYKDYVYAWNIDFDYGFLKFAGFDLGTKTPCPMKDSTDYFKIPKANRTHKGYKWAKAQEAWDILFPETPRTELHRGYDDSDMEARIIHKLINTGQFNPFTHIE